MSFITKFQTGDGVVHQLKDSSAVSVEAEAADKGKTIVVDNSGEFTLGSNGLMLKVEDSTTTVLQDGTDVTSQLPYEKTGKITINGEEKTANIHVVTITNNGVTTTLSLVGAT